MDSVKGVSYRLLNGVLNLGSRRQSENGKIKKGTGISREDPDNERGTLSVDALLRGDSPMDTATHSVLYSDLISNNPVNERFPSFDPDQDDLDTPQNINRDKMAKSRFSVSVCGPEAPEIYAPSGLDGPQLFSTSGHLEDLYIDDSETEIGQGTLYEEILARRGRLFAKRYKPRLVSKNGECNINSKNIKRKKLRYLTDYFTTLMEIKWRYIILLFLLCFTGTWILFALIWWLMIYLHNDHEHADIQNTTWVPCVEGVVDFPTALLFSIETMHTIGYGSRLVTPECAAGPIVLMIQSCVGVIVSSLMAGLVFAKLSRPKRRGQTIMFSNNAVICKRDGHLCFQFRIANMRKSQLLGVSVRAILVEKTKEPSGKTLPFQQKKLLLQTESNDACMFLAWPMTVMHKIDETSPFYEMSAEDLLLSTFEIIVFLEGAVEGTGMMTQVRTSYLPSEILWGHKLAPLMTYQTENGRFYIDYSRFNVTQATEISEESAKHQYRKGR